MTIEEAFLKLRIDPSANEDQIKKAFHELSLLHHPDISGQESGETQQNLNEAYNMATDFVKIKGGTVLPAAMENALQRMNINIMRSEFREETWSYVKKITAFNLNRNKPIVYSLWVIAALLGLLGFVGKEIIPDLAFSKITLEYAKIGTVLVGLYALVFQFMRENIKNRIEMISEEFHDKKAAAFELSSLLKFKPVDSFDFTEMMETDHRTVPTTILTLLGRISFAERARLLVLKAAEIGLIEPLQTDFINPDTINQYRLKFNPSDFGVFQEKPEPPPIKTVKEIKKEMRGAAILGAVCLIGTALIVFFFRTFWAVLPGLVAFGAIANFFALRSELLHHPSISIAIPDEQE